MTGIVCALAGNAVVAAAAGRTQPAATFTVSGAARSDVQEKFGSYSYVFDGTNDIITAPNIAEMRFVTGDFTVEIFAYTGTLHNGVLVAQQKTGSGSAGWVLRTLSDGRVVWESEDAANNASLYVQLVSSGTAMTANSWNHIAVARSGNSHYMYINGTRVVNASTSTRPSATSTELFTLGKGKGLEGGNFGSGDMYWNGYMDELRISDTARYTASTLTVPTAAFSADANTLMLVHFEETPTPTDHLT